MIKEYYDLIKKPLITEKSTILSEQNKFSFNVSVTATKQKVKSAVEAIFDVKVKNVHIINVLGKKKRFKGRMGTRVDVKKAIVTLETGHTIDFGGVVK